MEFKGDEYLIFLDSISLVDVINCLKLMRFIKISLLKYDYI